MFDEQQPYEGEGDSLGDRFQCKHSANPFNSKGYEFTSADVDPEVNLNGKIRNRRNATKNVCPPDSIEMSNKGNGNEFIDMSDEEIADISLIDVNGSEYNSKDELLFHVPYERRSGGRR